MNRSVQKCVGSESFTVGQKIIYELEEKWRWRNRRRRRKRRRRRWKRKEEEEGKRERWMRI